MASWWLLAGKEQWILLPQTAIATTGQEISAPPHGFFRDGHSRSTVRETGGPISLGDRRQWLIRVPDWIAPQQRADPAASYYLYDVLAVANEPRI